MSAIALQSHISGIHSKQPFFVLNSEHFHTRLAPDNPGVSHFYGFKAGHSQAPTIAIPDGCIDILFECHSTSPIAQVFGTRLAADWASFKPGHEYFGMRFLPGVIPDFLNVPAQELIDQDHDLHDISSDSDSLIEQITEGKTFSHKVNIMKQFINGYQHQESSLITRQLIEKICAKKGNIQVQDLERLSGYTSRTLQRMFKNDVGLTPKGFSRAIRCQSAVYDINHSEDLAFSDLAVDLGFSDQSHFLREFKKLVNITPLEYKNRVKEKTYLGRIYCH